METAVAEILTKIYAASDLFEMNISQKFAENPCMGLGWAKSKLGFLHPVQQPGSYWDRSSAFATCGSQTHTQR